MQHRRVASCSGGLGGLSPPHHAPIPCQSVPGRRRVRSANSVMAPGPGHGTSPTQWSALPKRSANPTGILMTDPVRTVPPLCPECDTAAERRAKSATKPYSGIIQLSHAQELCAETDWRVWREAATPEGRSGRPNPPFVTWAMSHSVNSQCTERR